MVSSVPCIGVGAQTFFCPKKCVEKINKMPEFCVNLVRKIIKVPEFFIIISRKMYVYVYVIICNNFTVTFNTCLFEFVS